MSRKMKIAACQMEVMPGNPLANTMKIIDKIHQAKQEGHDMIVFPEMAVSGYIIGDDWDNEALMKDVFNKNQKIIDASEGIIVVWGNVDIDTNNVGKDGRTRKYNAAFLAYNKKQLGSVHKTLLPNYREFDDQRYFYSYMDECFEKGIPVEDALQPIEVIYKGVPYQIGVSLCEDMWSDDYPMAPVEMLMENGADFMVNISCSPWTWRKNDKRHRVVKDRLQKKAIPFIYVNNTGIQNNGKNIFLFDGNTTFYHPDGSIQAMAVSYKEEMLSGWVFAGNRKAIASPALTKENDTKELYDGLVYGIKKFFQLSGFSKAVIGLSGGIDSALSAALISRAIGADSVYCVNMPSEFNSQTTKNLAIELAGNLGVKYAVVPIQESFELTRRQINNTVFEQKDGTGREERVGLSPLNEENIQARDRGSRVLAAIASAIGAIFINNGNKTETALGYATLYGDINGAIAPLADLYKTEVYQLAEYINRDLEIIPKGIISLPPSAELNAEQRVDEGKGDPIHYPYHDLLIRAFIVFRKDPEDILHAYLKGSLPDMLGCKPDLLDSLFPSKELFVLDLEKIWRAYRINYFKRIQSPPIIAVSKRAFGFDLRESQLPVYYTEKYKELRSEALG